jgi:hypothetical protein
MCLIIGVDSDPYISLSANPLKELNCDLKFLMKLKIVLILLEILQRRILFV